MLLLNSDRYINFVIFTKVTMLKKKQRVAIFVICFILLLGLLFLFIFETNKENQNYISVDYGMSIGTINLDYGLNEEANWMDFVERKEIHKLHEEVGSSFIRIWIDDPSFRSNSTIPYNNGIYDFRKLDSFINAALDSNAIPFIVFAHAPNEMSEYYIDYKNANPPWNNHDFADYCAEIVRHYRDMCNEDRLIKKCNVDEWYWEIWNEPYWDYWWENNRYIEMYNEAYKSIKEVAPGTNVGGYTLKFLSYDDRMMAEKFLNEADSLDFISLHIYGNYPISGIKNTMYIKNLENNAIKNEYEYAMIKNNKNLFFDQLISLNEAIGKYNKNTKIVVSELGPNWNWEYEPYFDEPFVSAWYASALNWMIKTNAVDKEFYYSGTSNYEDGGFAMWSIYNSNNSINLFPVYEMKKQFVNCNKKGSVVYGSDSNNPQIESIAVSNNDEYYLTVINKKNQLIENIKINIKNLDYNRSFNIKLKPYEVRFIKIK